MPGKIYVDEMHINDTPDAFALWKKQFAHYSAGSAVYPCWESDKDSIEKFIADKSRQGYALIARKEERAVGFIAFDIFNFHGADSVICHFCGNAAEMNDRISIYLALYSRLCGCCSERGIHNHYISINAGDLEARDLFFNLGFGSYGVDAYTGFEQPLRSASPYVVERAAISDVQAVYDLYMQQTHYFLQPPIHLRLPPCFKERIGAMIRQGKVYVARDHNEIIGMMDMEIAQEGNIYRMYTEGCCVVCGELGAYVREEYRGKGVGSQFIGVISEYCVRNRIPCAHVPWETFNPYANRFWRKYFAPVVLSLKRTIHSDI